MGEPVNATGAEIAARTLGLNIIFINGETLDIYRGLVNIIDPSWDTVVLLWVDQNHYELVGYRDDEYYITRRFKEDHRVFRWLRSHS